MAVFSEAFAERENLEKIVTLGDYLANRHLLHTQGALRFVREGGETGYSARALKDAAAAAELTRTIDALNQGRKWPLRRIVAQLTPMVGADVVVVVAPSHDPFLLDTPIRACAIRLAEATGSTDATRCLVRHSKIQRITYGGPSYVQLHLETIRVEERESIQDRCVLLVDDIARSGATLRACRQLLLESGARAVQMLALGRVWRG